MASREVPEFAHLLASMTGPGRGSFPPASQGISVGVTPPIAPVAHLRRGPLLIAAVAASLITLVAILSFVLVNKSRKDEER